MPSCCMAYWGLRVQLPGLLIRARGTLGMKGGLTACALVELAPLLSHCLGRSHLLSNQKPAHYALMC
jgi:hypothetical protein